MKQAEFDERFRNVKIVFAKLLHNIEAKHGEKIVLEPGPIRLKSAFEHQKELWKIEESPGCLN